MTQSLADHIDATPAQMDELIDRWRDVAEELGGGIVSLGLIDRHPGSPESLVDLAVGFQSDTAAARFEALVTQNRLVVSEGLLADFIGDLRKNSVVIVPTVDSRVIREGFRCAL